MRSATGLEYLDPNDADFTWQLKNGTGGSVLAGKFRHCLVALKGLTDNLRH
jgi:hypothetical protein